MNTVHVLVLPDGTLKVCKTASTAYLCHRELGAQLHELHFEEDKLSPKFTQTFGPSGVEMFGGQARRLNSAP